MALSGIDPIVLGHNNFIGVDHLSRQRGVARAAKFEQPDAILQMIRVSMDHGVRAMMMSTHPRASLVADAVRRSPALRDELGFYPLLPYIAKYVRQANEKGAVNVILDQLKGASIGKKLQILARGGMAMVRKDMFHVLKTLLAMEMTPFRELNLRAIFLHDVLTDLALALGLRKAFEFYIEEVRRQFGAEPAFATKNLPMLLDRFHDYGIERPLVLSHFNKVGFGMNPSRQACEACLTSGNVQVMAMGTLASGHLAPDEAYQYLSGRPHIDSVVVGVSSPDHAEETFGAIRRHSKMSKSGAHVIDTVSDVESQV